MEPVVPAPKKFPEPEPADDGYRPGPPPNPMYQQAGSLLQPLSEAAFCDWIASSVSGQAMQYHEGFLLLDRSEMHSSFPAKERMRIHAVARRAWIASELGLVHLFSQKVQDNRFRYLAVRSAAALTPPQIRTRLSAFSPTTPFNAH